jgi:hypothetical protein
MMRDSTWKCPRFVEEFLSDSCRLQLNLNRSPYVNLERILKL